MIQRFQRVLLTLLLFLGSALLAQDVRYIRLRTENIATAPRAARVQSAVPAPDDPAVSGLYLIQFQSVPDAAVRADLRRRGVDLLQYVPDDAFVARLQGVQLSSLRNEPGVRWVGPYEARHKMDPRLTELFSGAIGSKAPVRLLTRADLGGEDLALVFRHLQGARRRSVLGMGTTYEGSLNLAQLRMLAQSPAVLWIEPAPRMKLVDAVATEVVAGETISEGGLAEVHRLGYDGRGVIVSVADSGIDSGDPTFLHPDLDGRVEALMAYDNLPDASDEHSHGTHCAGIVLGNGATG
ncbi:MAG: S8 family serine peptidase, partial [Verrucomicrobiae bacterium]|nr:S8 family serine peptidase [Verrucomicrobiae bacterium]